MSEPERDPITGEILNPGAVAPPPAVAPSIPMFSPGAFAPTPNVAAAASGHQNVDETPPVLVDPTDPDTFGGTPGSGAAGEGGAQASGYEAMIKGAGLGYLPTGGLRPPTIMPGYRDYSGLGEEGTEFQQIQKRREEMGQAIDAGTEAEQAMGEQRSAVLSAEIERQKTENSVMAQKRQERMAGEQARQAQLDEATRHYSNELADTGKFWHNPGGIMASIGAALMALGGKAELGAQIVQNAIDNDLRKRKTLADMHLGELRSNVAAYRQLEGDKEAGDLRASIESKRIAMMEMDRIAAQFQGPLAKARNESAKATIMKSMQMEEINLFNMKVNNKPRIENPYIKAEYDRMGKVLPKGVGPTPIGGGTISKPNQGTITDASGKEIPVGPKAGSGQSLTPAHISATVPSKIVSDDGLTDAQVVALDKRFPGTSQRVRSAEFTNRADVLAKIGANPDLARLTKTQMLPNLTPQQRIAYNQGMLAVRQKVDEEYEKASLKLLPIAGRIDGFKMMKRDMEIMQAVANKATGGDVDALLGTKYDKFFGSGNVAQVSDWLSAGKPDGKHEKQAKALADAVFRFKQMRSGVVNTYFKDKFGAVSATDADRGNQTIPVGASYNAMRGFYESGSSAAQSEAGAIVNGIGNPMAQAIWQVRLGVDNNTLDVGGIDGPTTKQNPAGPGNTSNYRGDGPSREKSVPSSQDPEVRKKAIQQLSPAARKLLGG